MYRGMVERIAAIQRRCGVWLGLLALAFQLGLSIGHVHELDQDWGRAGAPTRASAILGPASDRSPAHVPAVPQEDRCQICSALAVCGTFIPPTAILVILAPVPAAARLDMPAEIGDLPLRPFSPAQPRAPPLAAILG
jgi:hypothetical protein